MAETTLTTMKDTAGKVHEIVPGGVRALESLGWELVQAPPAEPTGDEDTPDPEDTGEETPEEGAEDAAQAPEDAPADEEAEEAPAAAEEPAKPARRTRRSAANDKE